MRECFAQIDFHHVATFLVTPPIFLTRGDSPKPAHSANIGKGR